MFPIVYHPEYAMALRKGHRFPMSKYGYLRDVLIDQRILQRSNSFEPAPLSLEAIALAHDLDYVSHVFNLTLSADEIRRIGLPTSTRIVERTRLSSAGTTLAAWLAKEHGMACNMAGGSHHAGPAYGSGYCIFNDVAVAVRNLLAQGQPGPFLIVDADVHQGDGTARIFEHDRDVFTFSIHAEKNFPARKARSDRDIGLPDGTQDLDYLEALSESLSETIGEVNPNMIFYNAGVDVHLEDRLGRLDLSDSGIRGRDRAVLEAASARGIALVGVLGGGYSDDMAALAKRHAILFEEMKRFFRN